MSYQSNYTDQKAQKKSLKSHFRSRELGQTAAERMRCNRHTMLSVRMLRFTLVPCTLSTRQWTSCLVVRGVVEAGYQHINPISRRRNRSYIIMYDLFRRREIGFGVPKYYKKFREGWIGKIYLYYVIMFIVKTKNVILLFNISISYFDSRVD